MSAHTCPVIGCARAVSDRKLMCGPHWKLVPAPLQRSIYSAFYAGGVGSSELRAAHRAAITAVNTALEVKP